MTRNIKTAILLALVTLFLLVKSSFALGSDTDLNPLNLVRVAKYFGEFTVKACGEITVPSRIYRTKTASSVAITEGILKPRLPTTSIAMLPLACASPVNGIATSPQRFWGGFFGAYLGAMVFGMGAVVMFKSALALLIGGVVGAVIGAFLGKEFLSLVL